MKSNDQIYKEMPDVLILINLLINLTFIVFIEDTYPVCRSMFNHPNQNYKARH